jgi:hypothetical protein
MKDPDTHPPGYPLYGPDLRHLEADALRLLASGVDENDILLEVCERTGWGWPVAQEFLERLTLERGQELARRRFPLALVISVAGLVSGMAILGAAFLGLHDVATATWHVRRLEDLSQVFALLFLHAPTWQMSLLGAGMVAGGAIGLVRAAVDLGQGG